MSFIWWWQDKKEYALWKKLNSLSLEARESKKYKEICKLMIERYGNIYFYKPYPKQEAVHRDTSRYIFVHGDNSSGKSYCVASEIAYEVVGWSPYKEIRKPKYGHKLIWIFTPTFAIQKASSQVHLFSTDSEVDIGLLPRLEKIEEYGGRVIWQKHEKGALESVTFPDGTRIEFKSAEQKALTVASAGVDVVWADELIPKTIYNECIARIIRKDGRFIVSFIVDNPYDNYVVQELYTQYERDIAEKGYSQRSFHFFAIEDNLSLSPDTIEEKKAQFTEDERVWRFSGGKFMIHVFGDRVYPSFDEKLHVKDDLYTQYDPTRTIWRAWDLGRKRPVCIAGQFDKFGRLLVFFSHMGKDIQLIDFIEEVSRLTKEILPKAKFFFEILPHDARRGSDLTRHPVTAETIFQAKGLVTEVMYLHREYAIDIVEDKLRQLKGGEAIIQIDSKYAHPLITCLQAYTRDEKGNPREDGYFENLSDAFKLLVSFLFKNLSESEYDDKSDSAPKYFANLYYGVRNVEN
jgi:phage terminase large subunit-like protein